MVSLKQELYGPNGFGGLGGFATELDKLKQARSTTQAQQNGSSLDSEQARKERALKLLTMLKQSQQEQVGGGARSSGRIGEGRTGESSALTAEPAVIGDPGGSGSAIGGTAASATEEVLNPDAKLGSRPKVTREQMLKLLDEEISQLDARKQKLVKVREALLKKSSLTGAGREGLLTNIALGGSTVGEFLVGAVIVFLIMWCSSTEFRGLVKDRVGAGMGWVGGLTR